MSADLQGFNDIIEHLKSVINEPDFDTLFKSETADVPKAKQFLIKMELKRLAQPCNRVIDLRGNVAGDPFPFEYKGLIHHLDELGKQIFEQQIQKFGRYTVGTFEAVMAADNNNRVIHKKEQAQRIAEKQKELIEFSTKPLDSEREVAEKVISEFGSEVVHFTQYGIRNEERMNFSINVELQFGIGSILKASTSDLSISGAKVKIPAAKEVAIGQKVALYLTGLEEEFKLGLKDGIQYEIVGIDGAGSTYNYIRMKRTFTEDIDSFDDFLSKFINGNKRRYKVNLENTQDAIIIKGYEQYYLPRITTLPIFIREVKDRLVPTMVLATENNRATLGFFSDENKNLILQQIVNEKRIKQLQTSDKGIRETTLFCFTHARSEKLYFYCASAEDLNEDPEKRSVFLGFGSSKPSWQVFKLQLVDTKEEDSYIPLSIPDSAGEEIKNLNKPPSAKVRAMLKNVKFMAMLTPLDGRKFATDYQNSYPFDRAKVQILKEFGLPKLKKYISINVETIEHVNLRSEERYLYKTAVEIEPSQEQTDEDIEVGTTRDFSTQGLQIVLEQPCSYSKGDIVLLALPELQKITKAFKLNKLPYEIMAISLNKTVVNLRTFEASDKHHAKNFFNKLINQNINKLTPAKMESRYPGLSTCLRNLVATGINNLPIYFSKETNKFKVNTIGKSTEPNVLHNMMASHKPDNNDVTLYPILKGNAVSSVFAPILRGLKRTDRPKYTDLFVRFRFAQDTEDQAFICQYDSQFASEDAKKNFIETSIKRDCLCVYRIFLSRTGRPDMDYIAKELSYVGNYAVHRAKELEERLWNVVGVGDVVDISEEALFRYGFSIAEIQKQAQKKNRLLD